VGYFASPRRDGNIISFLRIPVNEKIGSFAIKITGFD
jgi:hypothetical protein